MTTFLVDKRGMIVGRRVAGRLLASGNVTPNAASFTNAMLERLPLGGQGSTTAAAAESIDEFREHAVSGM